MISFPKPPRTPRYVPAIDGKADPTMGVFPRRSEAERVARDQLPPDEHHRAGAVRCLIWIERP
jgi:hypothetical protein